MFLVHVIIGRSHCRKSPTYSELDSNLRKSYHCSLYCKRTGNVYTTTPPYIFPTSCSRFKSKRDATRWDEVGISLLPFLKILKKCSYFGKNTLIVFSYELTLRKNSVFLVILVPIFPHLDWIVSISPYSVRMRENVNQNNSEYGHFSHSVKFSFEMFFHEYLGKENSVTFPCVAFLSCAISKM